MSELDKDTTLMMMDESAWQRFRRVLKGLKAPKDSGEYRFSRFETMRFLSSWGLSVGISVLVVVILFTFAVGQAMTKDAAVEVVVLTPETVKLDEIKEEIQQIREDVDVTSDVAIDAPVVSDTPVDTPSPVKDVTPVTAPIMTKSPLVIKGLAGALGNRSAGGRSGALKAYGGTAAGEEAVLRALRWLKKYQEANGSWLPTAGGPIPDPGGEKYAGNAEAFTGLALLCFLAHGDTPASREFGVTVEKAMKWLVDHQKSDGSWNNSSGDLGYSHAMATYAVCEAFGMTKIMALKDSADKGVAYLVSRQAPNGGWNYLLRNPGDRQDVSVTAWCVQALKAAKIAGVGNLTEIEGALHKAVTCLSTVLYTGTGVFNYEVNNAGVGVAPIFPQVSCAAVLALQIAGAGKGKVCQGGLRWLRENATCNWKEPWGTNPFYYWYYTTQVMFQAGDPAWKEWNPRFATEAIKNQVVERNAIQDADGRMVDIGYWKPLHEKEYCQAFVYNTTMCTLQLEVYYRYLPTYKQVEAKAEAKPEAARPDDIVVDVR